MKITTSKNSKAKQVRLRWPRLDREKVKKSIFHQQLNLSTKSKHTHTQMQKLLINYIVRLLGIYILLDVHISHAASQTGRQPVRLSLKNNLSK